MAEPKNGNLKNFIAMVKTEGLMRTSRYTVSMRIPKAVTFFGFKPNMRKILLFCSDISIPGLTIASNQLRTHGEVREVPNEKMYDNASLSFYVDNNMEVKEYFDAWMNSIQDPFTRNFNYYDDYTTELIIDVEDTKDRKRYQITMYEAYPKNISPIQVGYDQKEVMKLQVSMNYKYWLSRGFEAPKETKESPYGRFLQPPTINNREISIPNSTPSPVPTQYTNDFTGFQQEYNGRA